VNPREIGLPFCVPCAADVLDKLGRAVSAIASMMGQMEATDRTIGVVGRRENGPDVGAEIDEIVDTITQEEYEAVLGVGEPSDVVSVDVDPAPPAL